MRIISDFHDYYDCMLTPGVKEPIWLRKQNQIAYPEQDYPFPKAPYRWLGHDLYIKTRFIGFCGKIDTVVVLVHQNKGHTFWSQEEAMAWLRLEKGEAWWREWGSRKKRFYGPVRDMERFYKKAAEVKGKKHFDISPIWIAQHGFGYVPGTLTYNPCLRRISYEKRVPPPQAYQELAMWIGNLASPEKPLPVIDDVTMAEAKGFNKYSFRKDKKCT